MSRLRNVLVLVRDVGHGLRFYNKGLGLPVLSCTDRYAELDSGSTVLALKHVDDEAQLSFGYTPFLNFNVADLDTTLTSLLRLGATLDGPLKHTVFGKVASVRSPFGQMIGLFEETPDLSSIASGAAGTGGDTATGKQ